MRFDSSGAVSTGLFDEDWRRFVIKMATGTGKTKVMSLAIAWSFFHKLYEQDSELSRNFLVIAPNIIVLDRLHHDFQGLRIFLEDPVLPITVLKVAIGETIFNSPCMSKTRYVLSVPPAISFSLISTASIPAINLHQHRMMKTVWTTSWVRNRREQQQILK